MTVVHVLDHSVPVMSGYSFRSRSIVRFQQRLGLRPVVVTSPKHGPAPAAVEELEGVLHYRTVPLGASASHRVPLAREMRTMLRLAPRIADVARRERAEVLHAHSPALNGLPALLVGRRLGLPIVYEARGFWEDAAVDLGTCRENSARYRATRAIETFLFRHADRTVTICEGMRRDLLRRGIAADRVEVVPNGVDTEWFRPMPRDAETATQLGLDGGPTLGFVGSFYRYEGLDLLLRAAPAIASSVPGSRLLLVGSGPEMTRVRSLAAGLGDRVLVPGPLAHDRIPRVYSAIDVFVCPRRRSRQTELVTPLKPLEAMAMARLVLASDVGGQAELIEPEVTGLMFRADDEGSLVAQAVRACQDNRLQRRIGHAARQRVLRERSWPLIVSRYAGLYAAVLRRSR